MIKYILNDDHDVVPVEDLFEWADWFETADRVVEETGLFDTCWVSTVFLGIDHNYWGGPPLVFETMVFGSSVEDLDDRAYRCCTWVQAQAQHDQIVALVKDAVEAKLKRVDDD